MKIRITAKAVRILLLLLILSAVISIPLADLWIKKDSDATVFFDTESIPAEKVGLVLGCGPNIYFHYRVDAAAKLFKAGKIQHILVSGDNHTSTYDEAGAMKKSLILRGIPAARISCDYAGFSTLDSIIRAKKVFGQDQLTIISQEFHVRRALFIAKRRNLKAIGYCAQDVETSIGAPTLMREALARVKTILDLYILHRTPRFLGEPVPIQLNQPPTNRNRPTISPDKA
ncbi:ElyC/SanA/YdcF family protein [Pontiellaceae bacterium B12227]|nr:ElyC/SanA/YdcF family protein [Pontiellaceae bacterium B12227]